MPRALGAVQNGGVPSIDESTGAWPGAESVLEVKLDDLVKKPEHIWVEHEKAIGCIGDDTSHRRHFG